MIALGMLACAGDPIEDVPTTGSSVPCPVAPCVADVADAAFVSPLGLGGSLGAVLTVTPTVVLVGAPYGIDFGIDPQVVGLSVPDLGETARWLGRGYDLTGIALGAADTDGDGAPEFAVGRTGFEDPPLGGRVQLVDPRQTGVCALDDCALLTIDGAASLPNEGSMSIGWGFAFAAQDRELWFTGSREGAGEDGAIMGAAYAYESALRGRLHAEDARRTITGPGFGGGISAWDATGDGIDDLAVQDTLGVRWWEGPWASGTSDDADGLWGSPCDVEREACHLGQAMEVVGDVTGDGVADLAIAAPELAAGAGGVYIDGGVDPGLPPSGSVELLPTRFHGQGPSEGLGYALTGGDFDGDGEQDLAVSSTGVWGWRGPGSVAVFRGPIAPGDYTAANADARVYGAQPEDLFGRALGSLDADGDGTEDLVVGAPAYDGVGAVYLIGGDALFAPTGDE